VPAFYSLESWDSPQIIGKFVHPCPSTSRLIEGYYLDYQEIVVFRTLFSFGSKAPGGPWPPHSRGFLWFLDHTQRHTTVGRTPLDEWSARRIDLYLTTNNTHNIQASMLPVGFELTISAGERPQTHTWARAATGTGYPNLLYQVTIHQTKTETSSDPQKQLTSVIRPGKDVLSLLGYYEVSTFISISVPAYLATFWHFSKLEPLATPLSECKASVCFVTSPQESCYGELSTPQQRYRCGEMNM